MAPNDVEKFLTTWYEGTSKTFFYTDREFIKEYVKIVKMDKEDYLIDGSSTSMINRKHRLTKEEIASLLSKDYLDEIATLFKTPQELKTGNCSCGSWVFGVQYPHTDWCDIKGWKI